MRDLMQKEIEVGSVIAYPGHQGSTTFMTVGVVVEIAGSKLKVRRVKTTGWNRVNPTEDKPVTVSRVDNVVVVDKKDLSFLSTPDGQQAESKSDYDAAELE